MASRNNFDRIASVYDFLVYLVFGKQLEEAQERLLHHIQPHEKVLVVGGGSGRILEQMFENQPICTVDYVEASSKMLALAKARLNADHRVNFIYGTQNEIPEEQYDRIITAFFLDVFDPVSLNHVIDLLKGKLRQEAAWLVTDFNDTGRISHRVLLWLMHRFFRLATGLQAKSLQPIGQTLQDQGMILSEQRNFRKGLIVTGLYKKS